MRPLIGISTYQTLETRGYYDRVNSFYPQSVIKAGGIPVLLPTCYNTKLANDFISKLSAIIFTGGNEFINPNLYGAPPSKFTTLLNPNRDNWEVALAKESLKSNIPILGICRGHQLLNVVEGGSLYYNIPDEVPTAIGHSAGKTEMWVPYHSVSIKPDSRLAKIFNKSSLNVNSYHSQAAKEIAPSFRVVAKSSDGIVEAIEHRDNNFVLGVQWHPEAMTEKYEEFNNLFKALVQAAKQ